MADVRGFDQLGNKILIPEDKVAETIAAGGRVATPEEIASANQAAADAAVQARYEALPLERKAAGLASTVASAVIPGSAMTFGSNPDAPPEIAEIGAARRQMLGAGLYDAGMRQVAEAVGGKPAGEAYALRREQEDTASPIAQAIGAGTGLVGSAIGGAGTGPAGAIGSLGNLAERGATRLLGGLAERGALGRAAATAAEMAARGTVEGMAYSGAEQAGDNLLHDRELGDKLYAALGHGALLGGGLGALVGAGGSLAASGARAARAGIMSRLAEGETAGSEALAKTGSLGELGRVLANPADAALSEANNQAWSAVGRGFGLQTSRYAKEAARYFENGTADLGEIARKYKLIDMGAADASPLAAAWAAAKSGTPDQIAPRAAMALETVGKQIGDMTAASGATIGTAEIRAAFREARAPFARIAGRESEVSALNAYEDSLLGKLGGQPALEGGNVPVRIQDVLEQRKGLAQIIYGETKTLDPRGRVQILRDARSELESLITRKLDEASGAVPGELRASYQALKKDYHGLRILTDAAEDSAARASKGATLGLGEKFALASALASGHLAAGPVLAVGGKMLKERGNAAAAAYLSRYAEQAALKAQMQQSAAKVAKAASNVLREQAPSAARQAAEAKPSPKAQEVSREQTRADAAETQRQATGIVKWVGNHSANPQRFAQQMEEAAALVGRVAGPQGAEAYTGAAMRAVRFIAAHIPAKERRDPLDPRSVPPLTQDEAERLVRATKYALKPDTILEDFGRGVITPEGLRGAKVLLPQQGPGSFADFQDQLLDHVTDHMLRNRQLTWTQRLNLDKLGIESLRPDRIARLQADMNAPAPEQPPAGRQGPGPIDMKIPQSGFDSVEARLAS